jgi:hypothetical protein
MENESREKEMDNTKVGPTTRNARAGSQSTIHPKRTGRRRSHATYRTHGPRWADRNNGRNKKRLLVDQSAGPDVGAAPTCLFSDILEDGMLTEHHKSN